MTHDDDDEPFAAMPIDTSWLDGAPEDLSTKARELIDHFNASMLYVHSANETIRAASEDLDKVPVWAGEAAMLLGLADSIITAVLKIAAIESIKAAPRFNAGAMDPDIVQAVGRSVIAPFLLAGVRYGQQHPDAFMAGVTELDLSSAVEAVLRGLADDQTSEGDE